MPIRPENRARYPADWPAISLEVRERAGWRCEGSPAYPDCRAANREPHPATGARVVLTVGHLNHTPEDCGEPGARTNLKAWCQRCHNTYDAPARREGIAARARLQLAEASASAGLPERVRRSRRKGDRAPLDAVYVGRPTAWGNPFVHATTPQLAVDAYARLLAPVPPQHFICEGGGLSLASNRAGGDPELARDFVLRHLHLLRGKRLACWCALDAPCHADVLLQLANR
jgi:hypothetical protein